MPCDAEFGEREEKLLLQVRLGGINCESKRKRRMSVSEEGDNRNYGGVFSQERMGWMIKKEGC